MQFETPQRPTRVHTQRDGVHQTPSFRNVYGSPYRPKDKETQSGGADQFFRHVTSDKTYRSIFTASIISLCLHVYLSVPMLWKYGLMYLLDEVSFSSLLPWYWFQFLLLSVHITLVFGLFAVRTWYKRAIAPKKSTTGGQMHFRKKVVNVFQKGKFKSILALQRKGKAAGKQQEIQETVTHHVTCRQYKKQSKQSIPSEMIKNMLKTSSDTQKARYSACKVWTDTTQSLEYVLPQVWNLGGVRNNTFACLPCPKEMEGLERVHTALRRYYRTITMDDQSYLLGKSRIVDLVPNAPLSELDKPLQYGYILQQGSMLAHRDGVCISKLLSGDSIGIDGIFCPDQGRYTPVYSSAAYGAQLLVTPLEEQRIFTLQKEGRTGELFSTWLIPEFRAAWSLLQSHETVNIQVDLSTLPIWDNMITTKDTITPDTILGLATHIYILKQGSVVDAQGRVYTSGDIQDVIPACIGGVSQTYTATSECTSLYKVSYQELLHDSRLSSVQINVCIAFARLVNLSTGQLGLKNVFLPYNSTVRTSLFHNHVFYMVSGCVTQSNRSKEQGIQVGITVREGDEILAVEDKFCTCGFDEENQGVFFSNYQHSEQGTEKERKYAKDVVYGSNLTHPGVQACIEYGDTTLLNEVMTEQCPVANLTVKVGRDAQALLVSLGAIVQLHKYQKQVYMRLLYTAIYPTIGADLHHGTISERIICVLDGSDEEQRQTSTSSPIHLFANKLQTSLSNTIVVSLSALRPLLQLDGELDNISVRSGLANQLSLLSSKQRLLFVVDGASEQVRALLARLSDRCFLVQVADHFGYLAQRKKLPMIPKFQQVPYPFDVERFLPFSVSPSTTETALWTEPPVFPFNRAHVNIGMEFADIDFLSTIGCLPSRQKTMPERDQPDALLLVDLVLMHGSDVDTPLFSRAYTRKRRVQRIFHVSLGEDTTQYVRYTVTSNQIVDPAIHYRRIANSIRGTSTGLALSGGGARGIAHYGVLQSLTQHGVDIDYLTGASQGACIAALYSMTAGWGLSSGALHAAVTGMGVSFGSIWSFLQDSTLPWISYLSGKTFNEGLLDVLSVTRTQITDREAYLKQSSLLQHQEDLWIPTITTVTNISRGCALYRREGWLFWNIRASMSILGFLPYCFGHQGDIWIDGGYADNSGVQPLLDAGCAHIIASDVESKNESHQYNVQPWGLYISGFKYSFWRMLRAFVPNTDHKKWYLPSFTGLVDTLQFLAHNHNLSHMERHIDLYLRPRVQEFKLLDYDKYEKIIDAGYQRTEGLIQEYLDKLHTY